MQRYILPLILASTMSMTAASAATLDFVAEANNNGERGIANGVPVTIDGVEVTFNAGPGVAYLDASSVAEVNAGGGAGLGVCSTGLTSKDQCVVSSDDNVTMGEAVTLTFDTAQTLSNLLFNAEGHIALISDTLTLLFGINGGATSSYTFADLMTQTFDDVLTVTFAYGGDNPDQYYVSAITVAPVPLPATLPLLLAGLTFLGFRAKRRRKLAA